MSKGTTRQSDFHGSLKAHRIQVHRCPSSESLPGCTLVSRLKLFYARVGEEGGARGGKGFSNNRGTEKRMGCTSGEYSSVAGKTMLDRFIIHGSTSSFTIDCNTLLVGVLSRTARPIGLGLCGREMSGTRIPVKTRSIGMTRIMKRKFRLCFANKFIITAYQILISNTSQFKCPPGLMPEHGHLNTVQATCF